MEGRAQAERRGVARSGGRGCGGRGGAWWEGAWPGGKAERGAVRSGVAGAASQGWEAESQGAWLRAGGVAPAVGQERGRGYDGQVCPLQSRDRGTFTLRGKRSGKRRWPSGWRDGGAGGDSGAGPFWGGGWSVLTNSALPCLVSEPGELLARVAGVTSERGGLVRLGGHYSPPRHPPSSPAALFYGSHHPKSCTSLRVTCT